jgi:hypothetical protein
MKFSAPVNCLGLTVCSRNLTEKSARDEHTCNNVGQMRINPYWIRAGDEYSCEGAELANGQICGLIYVSDKGNVEMQNSLA